MFPQQHFVTQFDKFFKILFRQFSANKRPNEYYKTSFVTSVFTINDRVNNSYIIRIRLKCSRKCSFYVNCGDECHSNTFYLYK